MKKYIIVLCLLLWPFGLLLGFNSVFLSSPLYLLDILVGINFLVFYIKNPKKIVPTPHSSIYQPLILFLVILALSLAINTGRLTSSQTIMSLLYFLRACFYPHLLFGADKFDKKDFSGLLSFIFKLFVLFGFIQYLFYPDMRIMKNLGFDDHYYRLVGTLLDPNFTGAALSLISFYFLFQKDYLTFLISLGALVLTFSRASYLSFLAPLIFLIIKNKNYKLITIFGLIALGVYFVPKPFGEGVNLLRTFSIFSRLDSWKTGVELFLQKPILGWGYNTLRNLNGIKVSIDNSFIFVLATSGMLGLISFVYFLYSIYKNSTLFGKTILLSVLTHSMFNNTYFFPWVSVLLFAMLSFSFKENKRP